MTTINTNNSINTSGTYTAKTNSQSEISNLQKERESLQKEVQSLQQELTSSSGDSSDTVQVQIETLQSQITNVNSQIAKLQAEEAKENSNVTKIPSKELENSKTLNTSLNKLDQSAKLLENEIVLEKARGFNTESKDEVLSNMKTNIGNISSKLEEVNEDVKSNKLWSDEDDLVGNFVNTEA